MWSKQFIDQVKSYGVKPPHGVAGSGGRIPFYKRTFDFQDTGCGQYRDYSETDVRNVVAWCTWQALTGTSSNGGMEAMRLLAEHTSGWVVASDDRVVWMEFPSPQVFVGGAICVPVPDWQ